MITLMLLLNFVFAQEPAVCTFMRTGDLPKIRFRGETPDIAMELVARTCMRLRTQQYHTLRGEYPRTERLILFMEDCINKTYCLDDRDHD